VKKPSSLNIITLPPISPLTIPNEYLKRNDFYQLRDQDLQLLSKFQTRTVFTITFYKSLPIYQNEIIKLACAVSEGFGMCIDIRLADCDGLGPVSDACRVGFDHDA
jgi:hypothetical protein